jgi:hypothetical protein
MRGFDFITTAVYGRLGYHCAQFLQLSTKSGTVVKVRGIPHLAKNERDVGHPGFVGQKEFVTLRIPIIRCSVLRVRPVASGLLVFDTTA